jgi:hypothetical protein
MTDEEQFRFSGKKLRFDTRAPSLLGRIIALLLGTAVLVLAFMFSLVLLAVAATVGVLALGYVWWKSRALRKQLREQMAEQPSGARIIEGEVIRDDTHGDRLLR